MIGSGFGNYYSVAGQNDEVDVVRMYVYIFFGGRWPSG